MENFLIKKTISYYYNKISKSHCISQKRFLTKYGMLRSPMYMIYVNDTPVCMKQHDSPNYLPAKSV